MYCIFFLDKDSLFIVYLVMFFIWNFIFNLMYKDWCVCEVENLDW